MTVTREQAQLLTTLAIACRPYRAPTWDEAGVMAAISRVKDKSLPEVALAVIRAASDREAQTPGVIAALNGSAWQEQLKPGRYEPRTWDPNEVCSVCSQKRVICDGAVKYGDDDHEFVSRAANARDTARPVEALERIVGDLHERIGGAA